MTFGLRTVRHNDNARRTLQRAPFQSYFLNPADGTNISGLYGQDCMRASRETLTPRLPHAG